MVTWQSTEPYWANESPQLEPAGTDSEDLALIGRGNIGPVHVVVRLRLRLRASRVYLSTASGLGAQEIRTRRANI
jgi:hypothetical protein